MPEYDNLDSTKGEVPFSTGARPTLEIEGEGLC